MNGRTERELMRLLAGELTAEEARVLKRRIAAQPELAAAHRRLEELWRDLEPPPPSPVPPGFATRVVARALAERGGGATLAAAPARVRAAAALALAAGIALGAGLGLWQDVGLLAGDETGDAELAESADPDDGLAAAYWNAFAEGEGAGEGGEVVR